MRLFKKSNALFKSQNNWFARDILKQLLPIFSTGLLRVNTKLFVSSERIPWPIFFTYPVYGNVRKLCQTETDFDFDWEVNRGGFQYENVEFY